MAITAQRLMVEVDADISGAEQGLEKVSSRGPRAFGWVGAAGAAMVGLGAAAAVGVGMTVKEAANLEQSAGAVDAVFKGSADTINAWARTAATSVGLSQDAYSSSASVIGAMLTNYGLAADKVASSTNDVVGYGADLAAMFGGTTQEAVDALGAALRGEADPAERFGLSLNKTAVNAHMAATGITNQSEATLDLIRKQMEASGAMGQFAREGETLQGAQQRLAAGWTNVQASIGDLFLPAAAAAVGMLATMLPHVQRVVDGLVGFRDLLTTGDFQGILTEAFNVSEDSPIVDFLLDMREAFLGAGGGFSGLLAAAQAAFSNVVTWLSSGGIQSILDAVLAGREQLFSAAMQVFPAILEAVVTVLPGLVQWVTGVMLPQVVALIVQAAPMLLGAAVTLFTGLITGVAQVLPAIVAAVATLLPQLLTALIGMVPTLLGAAVSLFTSLVTAVIQVIPVLLTAIVGMLPGLLTTLLGMVPGLLAAAVGLFTSLVQAVAEVLPVLLTTILGMLPDLVSSLLEMLPGILAAAVELFTALVDAVLTILPELLNTLLGTVLPNLLSTVLAMLPSLLTTGITLFVSLVTAIAKALPRIIAALIGILPTLIGTLLGMIPQILSAAVTVFLALVTGIAKALPQILSALAGMGRDMIASVGRIDLAAAGRTILDGFLRGLKNGFEAVKDFVGGIGSWIADNKGPKAYDLALLQPAGGWIMQGLREGIRDGIPELKRTLGAVSATIASPLAGPAAPRLSPTAMGATPGMAGGPTTLVFVDSDGALIGRMQAEAGRVATGRVTPLDHGLPTW